MRGWIVSGGFALVLLLQPAHALSSPQLQLVGFMPDVGTAVDVIVDSANGLAYTASPEFGLSVIDLGNPLQPAVMSAVNPSFYSEHIGADGDLAVAVSGASGGLRVIDVSNPTVPQRRGYIGGVFRAVTVVGRYAYAIETVVGNPATQALDVVDLANPDLPVVVGRTMVAVGFAPPLRIVGSIAYVGLGGSGLAVVDVSNPSSARVLTTVNTARQVSGIAVDSGYAYVADSTALYVVDVHIPARATAAGSLPDAATAVAVGPAGTLYVITSAGASLQIVDITHPSTPFVVTTTGCYGSQAIAAIGSEILLANGRQSGVYVIDARVRTAPSVLTRLYNGFGNSGFALAGSLAGATGRSAGMRAMDISNPLAPSILGTMGGDLRAVAMQGTYALVAQLTAGNPATMALLIVDLSAPAQPTVRSQVPFGSDFIQDIKIAGTLAYIATANGLQIMDVLSHPTSPITVGSLPISRGATAVSVVDGRYVYLGTPNGILVVDVSAPARPFQLGAYAAVVPSALASSNGMIYALQGGIAYIVDATTPSTPKAAGAINGYGAAGLDVIGNLLLLARPLTGHASSMAELLVVDVSVPAVPQIVQQVVLPGTTSGVVVNNGRVYVGDSATTVDVLEFNGAPPASPTATRVSSPIPTRILTPIPTLTSRPMSSPARTPTQPPTMTATPIVGIAGQVLYYSNAQPISGAILQLTNPVMQKPSDATGQYSFTGLSVGSQAVWVHKSGTFSSGISALDAVYVLESLNGSRTLSAAQQIACDVTGNGSLSPLDASMILQYKSGLIASLPVAQSCASDWAFLPLAQSSPSMQVTQPQIVTGSCQPGKVTFNPLGGIATGVNFSAVLFGDCTGNWQPTPSGPPTKAFSTATSVRLGRARRHGRRFAVPLLVQANDGFQGLDIRVGYDSTALKAVAVRPAPGTHGALMAANTSVAGEVVISLASVARLPAGEVLSLEFIATHAPVAAASIHVTHVTVE